jgi:hypothetical protein
MEEISSIYIATPAAKITASTNSFLLMKERGYSRDDISFCRINRYSDKVACLFDSGWLALKALYIMTSLN